MTSLQPSSRIPIVLHVGMIFAKDFSLPKEEERGKGMRMTTQLPDTVGSNQYASSALIHKTAAIPTTRFIQNRHPFESFLALRHFFPPHPQRDSET